MSSDEVTQGRSWSVDILQALLTRERLGSYLSACDDDLGRAFDLYEWNLAASAAVMHVTAMVEVILRNALDKRLCAWATDRGLDSWLDAAPLDERGRDDISRALGRATRTHEETPPHGRVVSELNLGFWRYLTASRYHASLWVPALREDCHEALTSEGDYPRPQLPRLLRHQRIHQGSISRPLGKQRLHPLGLLYGSLGRRDIDQPPRARADSERTSSGASSLASRSARHA